MTDYCWCGAVASQFERPWMAALNRNYSIGAVCCGGPERIAVDKQLQREQTVLVSWFLTCALFSLRKLHAACSSFFCSCYRSELMKRRWKRKTGHSHAAGRSCCLSPFDKCRFSASSDWIAPSPATCCIPQYVKLTVQQRDPAAWAPDFTQAFQVGGTLKGWSLTFGEWPVFRSDLINRAFSICDRINAQKQFFRYCALLCLYLSLDSLGYSLQLTCCRLTSGASSSLSWWFERGMLRHDLRQVCVILRKRHVTMSVIVGPANPAAFLLCNYWNALKCFSQPLFLYMYSFCSWLS